MNQSLTECLRELHLPGVLAGYENLAEVARRESFSYEKYLQEVVEARGNCDMRKGSRGFWVSRACRWRRPWRRSTAGGFR